MKKAADKLGNAIYPKSEINNTYTAQLPISKISEIPKPTNPSSRPIRFPNEDPIDYAGRVNEWKKLQTYKN